MNDTIKRIDAKTLKQYLHDGEEIALLDAREEVPYDQRHILMASCVPVGRLEIIADALVPRRNARVVWCDDGDGLAERAAERMYALAYNDISILEGGIAAWEAAGYRIYSGVHVPSKAFAEVIEHEAGTPYISAEELKTMMDDGTDMALFDSRSFEEYHVNSIPNAISIPGAELVYRFKDLVPSPDTTVVVNCGGRTRSIIGAQSLISAGFPNKIVSLMNGTQGWHLAGYEIIKGATDTVPKISADGLKAAQEAAARVAKKYDIPIIDKVSIGQWQKDAAKNSVYALDVRTREEYEAGHLPRIKHIPGGQLIQETDRHLGVWGGRVLLIDDNGVRATMTASWLKQMGWDVSVFVMDMTGELETGPHQRRVPGLEDTDGTYITPSALNDKLKDGTALVIDLDMSVHYLAGHIPGAWYLNRSNLAEDLTKLPKAELYVLTSSDSSLAQLSIYQTEKITETDAAFVQGGTDAWKEAGLPLEQGATKLASEVNDIRLKAREQNQDMEEAMREYLAWEIELVNQMATDDDQRFQVVA